MKFLIAASFLCLALVGQTQGGSLRGLTSIIPHKEYGIPLLGFGFNTEEIGEQKTNELPITTTTSRPFTHDLPLIDSVVNFGYPSGIPSTSPLKIEQPIQSHVEPLNTYLPPSPAVQQKVELPLLQPGLPALPAAPLVPLTIEKPAEVSHAYLPPRQEVAIAPATSFVSHQQITHIGQPSTVVFAGHAPAIQFAQQLSGAYLPPKPELPLLQPGLPSLPEAPKTPVIIEEPGKVEPTNTYLPPKPELPLLQPGLPELPKAPIVPLTTTTTTTTEQPILIHAELSNSYLPPKPLLQPGLPNLPEAPKVPITVAIEQPIHVEPTYLPPKKELPLLQPGLPALPEAPVVPKIPEAPVTPSPIQTIEEPKIGYNYEKPVPSTIEASQLSIAHEIKKEPIFVHKPVAQFQFAPIQIQRVPEIIVQPQHQVLVQHQTHQLFVQPSLQHQQQVLVQQSKPTAAAVPIVAEVNKATIEEPSSHHGYSYNPPKVEFLLPNQALF